MIYKVNELYINFVYSGNKQATKEIKQSIKKMTPENASKLWRSIQEAGDYLRS